MKSFKVLVADDTELNLILISRFIEKLGHTVILARDGQEAVDCFIREQPDLVLMDVMMPVMDGYQACARIREINPEHWIPVIFLSALATDQDMIKGLESGGDDYMTKPVSLVFLEAKIRAMRRIAALQKNIREKADELAIAYDRAEEEARLGGHLMEHLIDAPALHDPHVRHWLAPAGQFSGDLITATRSHSGALYAMLADATGHGLAAALNVLPASEVFHAMATRGFPVGAIAAEINRKLRALMPLDRFIAAALICIDPLREVVEIWNGGSPEVLLLDPAGRIVARAPSLHPPLGIFADTLFSNKTTTLNYLPGGEIFVCSDGLPEAEAPDHAQLGMQRLEQTLTNSPQDSRLTSLQLLLAEHLAGKRPHDDVSLLLLGLPPLEAFQAEITSKTPTQPARSQATQAAGWGVSFRFNIVQLRQLDIVPTITAILERLESASAHTGQLHLILSELFVNAMDHGLLQLDSSLKESPEGFELYLQTREERLASLNEGLIEIAIDSFDSDSAPMLRIHVKDSGPGFDFQRYLNPATNDALPHGRGIMLTRSLCDRLEYLNSGNEVIAWYRCAD